jgi:Zn-dependent M28 family amino/carboxypeptidase
MTQPAKAPVSFSGELALKQTAAVTEIGPRPAGTPAHEKMEQYILAELKKLSLTPEFDQFTASTPVGQRPMRNIIVRFKGQTDKAVVVCGHYDTKLETGFQFVGANDGGSSTGFLLEMARVLRNSPPRKLGVWLVFLDGEEAFREWTSTDSVYGSRHLAQRWHDSGEYRNIGAVILVDMIGDKDLGMLRDLNSTGWLNETVRDVARSLRLSQAFIDRQDTIQDDHIPFANIGLPVVDLIDFDYGPDNSYWHTARDTLDKVSARSLETVGRIVLGTIDALGKRN